jgi:hypothetical protein
MATLYGDTLGSLTNKQRGASQTLLGVADENNAIYGDAGMAITDSARGGGDILAGGDNTSTLSFSNDLFGDANTISGEGEGGDDTLTGGNNRGGFSLFNNLYRVNGFGDLSFDTTAQPGSTIIHAGVDQVVLVGFTGTLTSHGFSFA